MFYSLIAVDRRHRNDPQVVQMLIDALERVARRRFRVRPSRQRPAYIGEIAIPDDGPSSLKNYLKARGFQPLKTDETCWYRPRAAP